MSRRQSPWPITLLLVAMFSVINIAAATADQDRPVGDGMFIATTGRILSIDLKTRTIRVRGSDNERTPMFARTKAPVASSGITLPGGFTIHIPRRVDRIPSKTTTSSLGPDEYTVVLTGKTTIQDGADPIRLEDFSAGETISIHGIFSGNTLVASKIAKWSA